MSDHPGRDLAERRAEQLVRDVDRAGNILLGAAVRRAPIEEGTLRGSAALALVVNGSRFEGDGAIAAASVAARSAAAAGQSVTVLAEVSFNTVYAARQHQELDWNHPKGGQAKYLEQPLGELAPRLIVAITASNNRVS